MPEIVDHRSALERQLGAEWGWGADRGRQVHVPLPDWKNWQRIRLWNIEHLTAFRYTKNHHAITSVFTVETEQKRPNSQACMAAFEREGLQKLRRHRVKYNRISEVRRAWKKSDVVVHKTDGRAPFLFLRYDFSAAWTAYPAYDNGCLVYATVVLWDGQPELARRLRDRWVDEGVRQVSALTEAVPLRQPE